MVNKMQHFIKSVTFCEKRQNEFSVRQILQGGSAMLRLSVTKNEYLMIGKDVRLTFLGSNDRSLKIMIDAPKEINIARGKAIEKRAMEQEAAADRDWFD